jgi:hypothetical protein
MCYVYDTPYASASSSKQPFHCPPTPRKNHAAHRNLANDPVFFPSSSSILGTCVTDFSCDGSNEDSLLVNLNRLPVLTLVLKPQNKAASEARTAKQKLSISGVIGEIPPLPFQVAQRAPHEQPLPRSSSDPEQMSDSKRQAVESTSSNIKAPAMQRATIVNLPGSRRRCINAKCA